MAKQTPNTHPEPKELEGYLLQGDARVARHLEDCKECRTAIGLLRSRRLLAGAVPGSGSSEALVRRLASIPSLAAGPGRPPVRAQFVFDSWQERAPASVRHAGHGVERRLRYQANDFLIDLVVDRLGGRSECFLRVSRRGRPVPRLVLSLGRQRILPADIGFFAWTANRPPKRLNIWSSEMAVLLENLRW